MCIEIGFCRIRDIKPYREVFAPKTENMWRIIKNKRVIMTLPELQIWVCDGFSKPVCHLLLGYRQAVRPERCCYYLRVLIKVAKFDV